MKIKNKIVIRLEGGLGNQMFQFTFATIFAQMNKSRLLVDLSFYDENKRNIQYTSRNFELGIFEFIYSQALHTDITPFFKRSFFDKVKRKLGLNYHKVYQEPNYYYQENVFANKSPIYLQGYFQSYKYFIGYEAQIRKMFTICKSKLDLKNLDLLEEIQRESTISVHIRRGDYVENFKTQQSHGNCSIAYYNEAIELLVAMNKNVKLLFFSDDMDWVIKNFENIKLPKLFIDHNKNQDSWKDMLLMSSCTHNIIANSSFSWWGAWLNDNPSKVVVVPKYWYNNVKSSNDLIPENWIII